MRRRLMLAFVGLVLGVLVIAGAGSVILTDNAARTQATQQLATEAKSLTGHTFPLSTLKVMRRLLHLEDAAPHSRQRARTDLRGHTRWLDIGRLDAAEPPQR